MRVAFTGGREFKDRGFVFRYLDEFFRFEDIEFAGVGCARGLDKFVREYLLERGIRHKVFKARWDDLGKAAGGIRNQEILDYIRPHVLLSFEGGPGTRDMTERAKSMQKRGLNIQIIYPRQK